jgi:hypothetical protein
MPMITSAAPSASLNVEMMPPRMIGAAPTSPSTSCPSSPVEREPPAFLDSHVITTAQVVPAAGR